MGGEASAKAKINAHTLAVANYFFSRCPSETKTSFHGNCSIGNVSSNFNLLLKPAQKWGGRVEKHSRLFTYNKRPQKTYIIISIYIKSEILLHLNQKRK